MIKDEILVCTKCGKFGDQSTLAGIMCKDCLVQYTKQEGYRCDFCSDKFPIWMYDCADFTPAIAEFTDGSQLSLNSTAGWMACEPCKKLIEADKWKALERRSLKKLYYAKGIAPNKLMILTMEAVHQGFRNGKSKPRRFDS